MRIADSSCVESSTSWCWVGAIFLPALPLVAPHCYHFSSLWPHHQTSLNPVKPASCLLGEHFSLKPLFFLSTFSLSPSLSHSISQSLYLYIIFASQPSQQALPPALSVFQLQRTSLQHVGPHVSLPSPSIIPPQNTRAFWTAAGQLLCLYLQLKMYPHPQDFGEYLSINPPLTKIAC